MAIIALANLKGGVGKSTLAVNIAGALAPKSVLVDADPRATSTAWSEAGHLPFRVISAPLTGRNLDEWLEAMLGLEEELVIIDLPPMVDETSTAALIICDLAVVPVSPSAADLRATRQAVDLIRKARTHRKDGCPAALLVPSKVDRRTEAGAEIEAVLHGFGEPVGPAIVQRTAHADAFSAGQWIGVHAKGSAAHTEVKVLASVVRRLGEGRT